jgi:hypothetical protein
MHSVFVREAMDAHVALGDQHDSREGPGMTGRLVLEDLGLADACELEPGGELPEKLGQRLGCEAVRCAARDISDPVHAKHGRRDSIFTLALG